MYELAPRILSLVPQGWELTHIIITNHPAKGRKFLPADYIWQVHLVDEDYIIVATGESIEKALINASNKCQDPEANGSRRWRISDARLADDLDKPAPLSSLIKNLVPRQPINRRGL